MRQSLKIALSLLVSVLVFAAVAVAAFSGLFRVVEAAFFQPRVLRFHQQRLGEIAAKTEQYHRGNLERFAPVLVQGFVVSAYSANSSQEDNFNRENYFGKLLEEYSGLQVVRLLGPEGSALHFSTSRADYELQANRRVYKRPDRLDDPVDPAFLASSLEEGPKLILDGERGRMVYCLPVGSAQGFRGSALFYVAQNDLLQDLLRLPSLDIRDLTIVGRLGIVFDLAAAPPGLLSEAVAQAVSPHLGPGATEGLLSDPLLIRGSDGVEQGYNLLSARTGSFGFVSLLVPLSAFELEPIMKAILLASVFLTVFLIVFLILNLKQDPFLVLTHRIKRLQLGILQEFIEGKQQVDWGRWRDELVASRAVLSSRIKKGVGRLPGERESELDAMIDRSWDEIIGIIESRTGSRREAVDVSQVEQLIQKALDRGQISVQAGAKAPVPLAARHGGLVVEEIGVEEVVEPGQVERSDEEVEEIEEVAEAEEAGEPEEIAEAEEVEEVEEPEEIAEAEEVEEVEEIPEAEEVEEVGEPEEIAEVAEIVGAAETEEVEEIPEAEGVEEVVEPEEIAEVVEIVGAAEKEAITEAEELVEAAETGMVTPQRITVAVEIEEEPLEELASVKNLVPLPPLPQEELEELPAAVEEPVVTAAAAAVKTTDQATVEELETAEELSPVEALLATGQELEMEELPGQASRRLSAEEIERLQQAEEERQLDELEKSGIIQSFSLEEFERLVLEQRTNVVLEGGVYQIKEEVKSRAAGGRRRGLMAVAEAVLAPTAKPEEPHAPAAESGIGSLLGEGSLLDLAGEMVPDRQTRGQEIAVRTSRVRKIRFFDNGLDYDGYLDAFRRGKTETDRLRSLVELSRKLKAVNAGIFVAQEGRFEARLKVGLLDPGGALGFSAEEPAGMRYLGPRRTVVVSDSLEKVKALSRHFHPDDLKYMQGALFLPVVYQGANAVLFLGLPVKKHWRISEIIESLNIY